MLKHYVGLVEKKSSPILSSDPSTLYAGARGESEVKYCGMWIAPWHSSDSSPDGFTPAADLHKYAYTDGTTFYLARGPAGSP